MVSSTSALIVRLSLDATNFEGAMSKFEGQMTNDMYPVFWTPG